MHGELCLLSAPFPFVKLDSDEKKGSVVLYTVRYTPFLGADVGFRVWLHSAACNEVLGPLCCLFSPEDVVCGAHCGFSARVCSSLCSEFALGNATRHQ